MQTSFYFRSPVLNFFELSEVQKETVSKEMDYLNPSELEEQNFVFDKQRNEIFPLSMFMRIDKPGIFCGVYTTSAFSACFLALSRCGSEAVFVSKYW